jgi:hypothetical protein
LQIIHAPLGGQKTDAMRTKILLILSLIYLCFINVSCSSSNPPALLCKDTVDAVTILQDSHPLFDNPSPSAFLQGLADGTIERFDINEYFSVFPHLSVEPSYVLDYVYLYRPAGGEPVIYARPIEQPSFLTYAEYEEVKYPDGFPGWPEIRYGITDHIRVDDTAQGFLEFIVFRTMGSQFYQYGHAGYNDVKIICDPPSLETLLKSLDHPPLWVIPSDVQQKARSLDFQPVVEIRDDTVLVKVVTFSKWGGFIRGSYIISRDFPHKILEEKKETLVEYDCGVDI